ncbi:MAG: alpha-amylase [Cyanobacteria bacterium J06656_5]
MASINGVMMQYFHWYLPSDGSLWTQVNTLSKELADAGFTAVWLPPAYKGMGGGYDIGYAAYDLYDLGEFDQRGSVRTKYGTKDEYVDAIQALHSSGLMVYADVVLNQRMGGDQTEITRATLFSQDDRLAPKGYSQEVEVYSHFSFPGRQGKYSKFEWHWWHFNAVDYAENRKALGEIYLFEGKNFDDYVALEKGNFAYLMGADVDFLSPEVQQEITQWGKWYLDTTSVDGFRLDAIKHIAAWFFQQWIGDLEQHVQKDLFLFGEYWFNDLSTLQWYVDSLGGYVSIFDVPLHYNFHYASKAGGNYDMRKILDGTMMQTRPTHAITFVENHDSQPLQALESPVEQWFKPLAYAIILLRQDGYPCVFYADYYGAQYEDYGIDGNRYPITLHSHRWLIDKFLYVRRNYVYGPQYDYFDHIDTIGWTCIGDADHPKAMAVIMSDAAAGKKWMEVGKKNTVFLDVTENIQEPITTNEHGWGEFSCNGGSVSVWIEQ